MRMIRKWEDRRSPELRLEKPQFWGAIAGALVGAVANKVLGGGDDSSQQRQQAQTVSVNQEKLFGVQAETGQWQLEQSKELWDLWKNEQLPLIRQAVANIERPGGVEGAIAQARGDVAGQYARARAGIKRDMELSRNPADAAYGQNLTYLRGAEAGDIANAIYGARRGEQDAEWQRRAQAIAMFSDPSGAASAAAGRSAATTGAAASGLGQVAAGYRANAAQTDLANTRGGYAWGNILSPAISAISNKVDQYFATPTQTTNYGSTWDPGSWDWSSAQDYGGYYGYRHGGAIPVRVGYADGGEIRGPGSGVSDSIKTTMRPGSYVLSADTVRALGTKKIDDLLEKSGVRPGMGGMGQGNVPVHVSNGEAEIPPETVKYFGEEFFNKLQQKYHRPVQDDTGMANGGAIRLAALPRNVEDAIFRAIPAKAIGRR